MKLILFTCELSIGALGFIQKCLTRVCFADSLLCKLDLNGE